MTKLLDLKENCIIMLINLFHVNLNLYLFTHMYSSCILIVVITIGNLMDEGITPM